METISQVLFWVAEPSPQYSHTIRKTNDSLERNDHCHILQSHCILKVVGQLGFGLQDSNRISSGNENTTDQSEQSCLPAFPKTKLQQAIDQDK